MTLKLIKNFSAALSGDLVVRYSHSDETKGNWGDVLNEFLVPKLSGRRIVHFRDVANLGFPRVYSVIGSVLDNSSTRNLHVWGSGFKAADSRMRKLPAQVYAVRGPSTRRKLMDFGVAVPPVYGDPALLIDRFIEPSRSKRYRLGVIPHYMDRNAPAIQQAKSDEILIIDVNLPIAEFVKQVTSCEVVASSSLHGLIAADCYQVPSVWIRVSDRVVGGDFKFNDYFGGVGISKRVVHFGENTKMDALFASAEYKPLSFDAVKILEACPFLREDFPR